VALATLTKPQTTAPSKLTKPQTVARRMAAAFPQAEGAPLSDHIADADLLSKVEALGAMTLDKVCTGLDWREERLVWREN